MMLVNAWKRRPGGPYDAGAFMRMLESSYTNEKTKIELLEAFNGWDVLVSTWFEVADYLHVAENLWKDEKFKGRYLAALLISKVYLCLEKYEHALDYALHADEVFSLIPKPPHPVLGDKDEEYVSKIVEVALDNYVALRHADEIADERLEKLVNRIFNRNVELNHIHYVLSLGMETRREDRIKEAVLKSKNPVATMSQLLNQIIANQYEENFQYKTLELLVQISLELPKKNYIFVIQCYILLKNVNQVQRLLWDFLNDSETVSPLVYQIVFDLYDNASAQFNTNIISYLNEKLEELIEINEQLAERNGGIDEVRVVQQREARLKEAVPAVVSILAGNETVQTNMDFLIKNNHTDMLILKEMKDSVRTATALNGTLIANGIMHLGTTCDDFLRDHLDWIGKATNWNKFNAVASLGLIHRGHEASALKILEPYLPKQESDQFGFKEGGSLYAYGLMHAKRVKPDVIRFLTEQLATAQTSAHRHGAALGLGVASIMSHNYETYGKLRDGLQLDDAVTGEAAAVGMGLTMAGSLNPEAIREMTQYIVDTTHDKIQRGLRTGVAMLAVGRGKDADPFINDLLEVKSNAVLRATGVNMLAMAYAGTENTEILEKLLDRIATDPNNDVKRFAAMALGYVLCFDPQTCLSYVSMLVEHFNPHVRYGAAMAAGIACAGTGYKEAVALLEPMLQAKENFVRQGAVIALSFVLIQQTEASCSNVVQFRKTLTKMIAEKSEDAMAKFGAIIAQGIIDAGGRNVTVSLKNRYRNLDVTACCGMLAFQQYWYWHTFTNFIALTMQPTSLIVLNTNLKMPNMQFKSNAKPALYSYPPPIETKKKEEGERVDTAVLSTTVKKVKQRKFRTLFEFKNELMERSEQEAALAAELATAMTPRSKLPSVPPGFEPIVKKEDEKKPVNLIPELQNPARVVRLQLQSLSIQDSRYKPVKPLNQGGIVIVEDKDPKAPEDLVAQSIAGGIPETKPVIEERTAPAAFEFDENKY